MAAAPLKELPQTDPTALLTQLMTTLSAYDPTTKTETSGSPGAQANIDSILAQLTQQLGSGAYSKDAAFKDSDALLAQIFQSYRENDLPQIYNAQVNSGGYNSSTAQLMANDAFSRAVVQSQATKLKAATDYGQVNNQLANAATAAGNVATKTNQTSTQQKNASGITKAVGAATVLGKAAPFLLSKGAGAAGSAIKKKLGNTNSQNQRMSDDISNAYDGGGTGSDAVSSIGAGSEATGSAGLSGLSDTTPSEVTQLLQSAGLVADNAAVSPPTNELINSADTPTNGVTDAATSTALSASAESSDVAEGLFTKKIPDIAEESLVDYGSSNLADPAFDVGENLVNNFAADGAADLATEGALDFGFPYYTAFKAAGDIFGINEINDITAGVSEAVGGVLDGIGDFAGDVVDGIGDVFGGIGDAIGFGGSVICSELRRQEIITQRERMKNYSLFRKHLSPTTIAGYKWWASFIVRKMQKSEGWTKFGKYILDSWIQEMKTHDSVFGKFLHYIVRPPTFLIGCIIELMDADNLSRST